MVVVQKGIKRHLANYMKSCDLSYTMQIWPVYLTKHVIQFITHRTHDKIIIIIYNSYAQLVRAVNILLSMTVINEIGSMGSELRYTLKGDTGNRDVIET